MVARAFGSRRAVFLDRDGVIVIPEFRDAIAREDGRGALKSFAPRRLADFRIYPEARTSLQKLKAAGFLLVVVTNQPDVGNGLVPRPEVEAMHEILARELPVDAILVCFHSQTGNCDCRKPKPGMILEAARAFGIGLTRSFMVGDRASDIAAGRAAGCATVFIGRGYAEPGPDAPDHVAGSIAQAADIILNATKEPS